MKTKLNETRCRKNWIAYLLMRKLHKVYKEFLNLLKQVLLEYPHEYFPLIKIKIKVIGNVL